ncbi:GCN5-related N-acetyltransferase [Hylemonella gracilis ATCC 19624]|uniref:GCN5-related N-acetyltransferase n=1 Tax=Hylemonella gracilis ATCC 19624 TaxID=887062 RepID=F3KT26_9BURK|nr:GCN5-related N-acetyltransferase [Hylemonella gracilis ATCC 19624]
MPYLTPPTTLNARDLAAVQAQLAQARLPFEDLLPTSMPLFLGVRDSDSGLSRDVTQPGPLIAFAGLESHGVEGLLRSLWVRPDHRGRGLARTLLHAHESQARQLGLNRLVLLTESAADFFQALGYRETDRTALSAQLRASTQFQQLCPASAHCLSKTL